MKKKQWLTIVAILALIVSFIIPTFEVKAESEWQKLDRQLQEIQKQKNEAAKKAKNLDNQIKQTQSQHQVLENEIYQIDSEIEETEKELFTLEKEIEQVTDEAKLAAEELDQAINRVEERDQLLKTRVKLMYQKGTVNYIEVLLGSNSFADFLQRFSALQKIINSDKKILVSNIEDRNTIEQKKIEIDQALTNLEELYTEAENIKVSLMTKKEDRKVKIASLEEKEQELEEIREEEENYLKNLASKEAEVIKKQHELIYNGGFFTWPVPVSKRITSDFGRRIDPINGKISGHTGIDIGRAPGTDSLYGANIVAAADGIVIVASYVGGYGNTVIIDHGSDIWTLYGHIRNGGIFVKVGQKIKRGQKIAEVGSTGRSTGPHLHFEVRKNQEPVNPWDFFAK